MIYTPRKTTPIWKREHWSHVHKSPKKTEITNKGRKYHFGNILIRQTLEKELLVGFLKIHYLHISRKGENNSDLFHITNKNKFDHVGIADTGKHWTSLPDDDRIIQIFRGHFMSHQLESSPVYNHHNPLLA